jgi:hypothetical protein
MGSETAITVINLPSGRCKLRIRHRKRSLARNASTGDIWLCGLLPLPAQRCGPMCRASPDSIGRAGTAPDGSAALTNLASLLESGPAFSSMNGMSRRCTLSHPGAWPACDAGAAACVSAPSTGRRALARCASFVSQTQDSAAPAPCQAPISVMGGGCKRLNTTQLGSMPGRLTALACQVWRDARPMRPTPENEGPFRRANSARLPRVRCGSGTPNGPLSATVGMNPPFAYCGRPAKR